MPAEDKYSLRLDAIALWWWNSRDFRDCRIFQISCHCLVRIRICAKGRRQWMWMKCIATYNIRCLYNVPLSYWREEKWCVADSSALLQLLRYAQSQVDALLLLSRRFQFAEVFCTAADYKDMSVVPSRWHNFVIACVHCTAHMNNHIEAYLPPICQHCHCGLS